ncbi:acyl-CoA dehydrogenase, C-terminal domain protein [Mycobacterium ulcerans str. Harvey]|uniref:Acyl-CoA dehydrogenase, C-terminal domain protein n=1 Tax=Mycobacterium ulcerans str. Harvey TaxID=1299332 RepID=A0ABN0QVD3_MYCUL|nr:acyl-CoA dehydrogenase, C-terminal domain protein [Mycobacterium ulcerans str. Harvey]
MLGGAEACLDLAIEYACSRKQFDRPIGSFQAVKHRCADMMIEIDATRAAVMFAQLCAPAGRTARHRPLAKAQAAGTYVVCGLGYPGSRRDRLHLEHDLHLYFRRARDRSLVRQQCASPVAVGRSCRPLAVSDGADLGPTAASAAS